MTAGSLNLVLRDDNRDWVVDTLTRRGFDARVAPTTGADVIIYHTRKQATVIEGGDHVSLSGPTVTISIPDRADVILTAPGAAPFDVLAGTLDTVVSHLWSDVRDALSTFSDTAVWMPTGTTDRNLAGWPEPSGGAAGGNEPPAPPAAPVSLDPPPMPEGVRIVEPPATWDRLPGEEGIAFCGGIPGVRPWHDEGAVMLANRYVDTAAYRAGRRLAILIPRRRDFRRADDGTVWVGDEPWTPQAQSEQVGWEWDHIRSGHALFWYPESDPRFVMPTTMLELGLAYKRVPMTVGAHPGYARRDIVEHVTPRMGLELFGTLSDTVDQAVRQLNTDIH